MKKFLDYAAGSYVAIVAALMVWDMIGEALTGGIRLDARPVAEVVEPWQAATMFVWLLCSVYVGFRHAWRNF